MGHQFELTDDEMQIVFVNRIKGQEQQKLNAQITIDVLETGAIPGSTEELAQAFKQRDNAQKVINILVGMYEEKFGGFPELSVVPQPAEHTEPEAVAEAE